MMKLKINKTFIKGLKRKKNRNQKNKDWIRKNNTWQIGIEVLHRKPIKFL
jgi:hypothetical protein